MAVLIELSPWWQENKVGGRSPATPCALKTKELGAGDTNVCNLGVIGQKDEFF